MEAFSLLKFWKSSSSPATVTSLPSTTILSAVSDADESSAAGDDGPFFDLELAPPDSDSDDDSDDDDKSVSVAELVCLESNCADAGGDVVEETEIDDLLNSDRSDPNLPVSPSEEDLFFHAVESGSDPNSVKPQLFPVSLVRSATRLRILMSGFKKSSRPTQAQAQAQPDPKQTQQQQPQRRKLFTIKFKPGEVPIVSLFTKDHTSPRPPNGVVSSLSSSSSTSSSSSSTQNPNGAESDPNSTAPDRNPKDGVQKYFKMVKPLYIRVSKRYGEKLGFSGQLNLSSAASQATPGEEEGEKGGGLKMQGSLAVGLKVMMRKRLSGKSKTAEAGMVHTAAAAAARQRDDSLMQQQEWIQGAILHCKRSFNASREDDESATVLCRSASDPSYEKTVNKC